MKTTTKSPLKMHNPPHPGEVLRGLCLAPLGLTVTQAAAALGVSRKTLSSILNGRSGISAEMAIRLSIAFNTTAESWLLQQLKYDLAQVEPKRRSLQVKRLAAA
jgi:addiction module HigA family antidote